VEWLCPFWVMCSDVLLWGRFQPKGVAPKGGLKDCPML